MIPFVYRRPSFVRIESGPQGCLAVSDTPLRVFRINEAAATLLELSNGARPLSEVARELGVPEVRMFQLCESFRARGLLDLLPDARPSEHVPLVSVVIPTRDRSRELSACLEAVFCQDYPSDKLEVIVVDDASTESIERVVDGYSCRLISNPVNRGQSFCRNVAAASASGELLAFIDSDCVPTPGWLRELVPFLQWPHVAAVGGGVLSYYRQTALDRYEAAASSLSMGSRPMLASGDSESMFYVPTCNLLVRKSVYEQLRGLRESMRLGEDVDFCWRARRAGFYVMYTPNGAVYHRHRNGLMSMLRRKAQYGTSEAVLHRLHPDRTKALTVRPLPAATAALLAASLIGRRPRLALSCLVPMLLETVARVRHMRGEGVSMPLHFTVLAVIRNHAGFALSIASYVSRYWLVPLTAIGLFARPPRVIGGLALIASTCGDYLARRPQLHLCSFMLLSSLDRVAYQVGVAAGAARARTLAPYRMSLGLHPLTFHRHLSS